MKNEVIRRLVIVLGVFLLGSTTAARAEPQWLTLPATLSLPTPVKSGYAPNIVRSIAASVSRAGREKLGCPL